MRHSILGNGLVALGFVVIAGPALAQSKTAIQKLEDQWGAAFNKGDAAAVAAMYTEEAYVLPAGAPLVKGRADIQNFWGRAMQQLSDVKCTAADVMPIGRTGAREIGTCSFKTKGASPQDGALKYAVVWRKVNGQWLLNTDIWNMDK
ncbi:MAG TPA: SgcJ/EcaC family oxidoreductase [Stellaceae bacterium]|nr:SgcJ/EcaC family oxidoreductase [Stellaceae bacterium]